MYEMTARCMLSLRPFTERINYDTYIGGFPQNIGPICILHWGGMVNSLHLYIKFHIISQLLYVLYYIILK